MSQALTEGELTAVIGAASLLMFPRGLLFRLMHVERRR